MVVVVMGMRFVGRVVVVMLVPIERQGSLSAEAEAAPARAALDREASRIGFAIERTTIEALGLCPGCKAAA